MQCPKLFDHGEWVEIKVGSMKSSFTKESVAILTMTNNKIEILHNAQVKTKFDATEEFYGELQKAIYGEKR